MRISQVGGDLLMATVDGILPVSAAISKGKAELELAAVTRNIKSMWRDEVLDKRDQPWTLCNWDEYGGIFVTLPGGAPGQRRCLGVNSATGAWCRFTGWDATCFMQACAATCFSARRTASSCRPTAPAMMMACPTWRPWSAAGKCFSRRRKPSPGGRRGRRSRRAPHEPFIPQLSATTDYVVTIPTPPLAGVDPGVLDLWDQGLWDEALWDQPDAADAGGAQYRLGVDRPDRVFACADRAGDGGAGSQAGGGTDCDCGDVRAQV